MPNKFITNLDLARQANIFSGETAVFQGGIQLGIPFSGFPTGVDTGTTVSLGVVDTQFAAFSGNTGTTVFNVTDPTSPFYSAASTTTLAFSPYTIIDSDTVTETVSSTSYPSLMSFTSTTGTIAEPTDAIFSAPVVQELYDDGLYGSLFNNLGSSFTGATFIDESFYNRASIFSGATINMEIIAYGTHGSSPTLTTGTTSGTVIEYSALTQYWSDTTIINLTSGLTLPITTESADTQTSDYVWTLTSSEIIDENLIGLQYTGYSVTYSFDNVIVDPNSPSITGGTTADTYYLGSVTATYENFSAGTLDYKGSTNWITIDGNATVTERLTVDRLTINNPDTGTSVSTLGIDVDGKVITKTSSTSVTGLTFNDTTYDLTLGIDDGTTFTDSLAILASDIKVTGGTFDDSSGEITFTNNSGGTFAISGLSTDFTGNTSGTCITDLHISNLHSCSPLYINPLDEGNVYFGSTSGVTIDIANNRMGIGTQTPNSQLHIAGSGANTILRVESEDQNNAVVTIGSQNSGAGSTRNSLVQFQENSTTKWMIGMNGLAGGSEENQQLVIANGTNFDTDNILNINPSNGYVGLGVQAPTERLHINGNIKISGGFNIDTIGSGTSVTNLGVDSSGNIVSGTTGGGGSSPWVDNGSSIVYSGHGDYVEFKDDYFQIAPDSTSNTIGANSNQSTYIGTGITAAANSTTRTLVLGINHTVADTAFVADSIIAGNTNTIGGGSNNLIVGASIDVDAANNSWIGGNTGNNITSISDSLIFSTGLIKLTDTMVDCVILGNSQFGVKGDTVFGFGDDLYGNSTSNNEVMMLGFNVQLNNPTSKSILIGSGQNDGQYLQINSTYEKGIYYGVGSSKPWFALTEAQSGVGTGTSGKVGNIFFGVDIADEGGTANVGEGIMWLQESTVNPSANITDAGALYNSGGTITWWDGTTNYNLTSSGGGSGEVNTASNVGSGEGLFSGKSGVDLQFKSLSSTGGTITISTTGATVNLESLGDVSTVGTPGNNELAVWTGDGTLEGESSWTFNSSTFRSHIISDFARLGVKNGAGSRYVELRAVSPQVYLVDGANTTQYFYDAITTGSGQDFKIQADGSGVHYTYFDSSGGVGIGAGNSLDAMLHVKGSGATSGTTAFVVKNSSNATLLEVKDDGEVVIPTIGSGTSVTNLGVDSIGNIVSGTTGGGSSLWTDKGDSGNGINYTSGDANQSYVEINSGTGGNLNTFNADQYRFGGLFIGYNNDFGTASNDIDSSVGMGTQNTWGALGDVSYTLGIGSTNEIKSGVAGFAVGANIEISGNYNVALGQSHEVYGADNKAIGQSIFIGKAANLRNNCVGIGDSMQMGKSGGADHHVSIGFGINTQYYTNERAIFFGTQTGNNSRPSAGFFQDPGGTSTHPSNFVMGSMNAMRTGAPYPAQSGAGNGIFYLHDADSLGVVAPSVNVTQAVALFASDRDSPAGNPDVTGLLVKSENGGKSWIGDRIGINVSYTGTDPDLTTSIDASLHIRGEGATNATSSLIINDSGTNVNFKVTDDGVTIFRTFTVATLPTVVAGGFIYVSDETGGATMAFSDGTNWRRVQDRAIVS